MRSPQRNGCGEKRSAKTAEEAAKRRRKGGGEEEMRRVAEIVLVLSAMGRMRGGREPTVVEKAMMAEARRKVVLLCEELTPKDVVPREVFGGVMEDLGLNRLKDYRVRSLKPSISERISLTMLKMKESKAFAAQPAPFTSQRLQTVNGVAGENHGAPTPVHVFSADKVGQLPVSSGTFQAPASVAHGSRSASIPVTIKPANADVRPTVVSSVVPSNTEKGPISVVSPRIDRAHIRPDGRSNGLSSVPHVSGSSAADRHTLRTAPAHMQAQPSPQMNNVANSKAPDQLPMRTVNTGAPQMNVQPAAVQTLKPLVSQAASGSIPTMHGSMPTMYHPVQGMQYIHPPILNHHVEISKVVQRLLNPRTLHPAWTPASRDYMNKGLPCQFCKLVINEVENVVVCDACEKAFHLGCLQSYNTKGIPRGEWPWHCPRCMTMSHGKPFPPKYGRVTRNMNAPKGTSNTVVAQFPSEKKMGSINENLILPKAMRNSSVDIRKQSPVVKVAESYSNLPQGSVTGKDVMSVGFKKEDGTCIEESHRNTIGAAVDASKSMSVESSSDKTPQLVLKSESSLPEDGFMSETESNTSVIPQANNAADNLPISSNHNDIDQKVSNGADSSILQHNCKNGDVQCAQSYNEERFEKDAKQQNLIETDRVQDQAGELVGSSENGLPNVDWIGDLVRLVDEKKYFRSCRINGVIYQVQDYALFYSDNGKLTPWRIQDMWEDSHTTSKWLLVHKCYFPDDLPPESGRPGAPKSNEVYESTHFSNVMAGFIRGPCEVLPFRKFGEETNISDQGCQGTRPVFIRNWFYDESKRAFCPSAS